MSITKEDTNKNRDQLDRASLEEQRRHDFDVIFLLAPPQSARQIVPLLRFYYVDKTAIFATSVVYAGMPQPQKDYWLEWRHFPVIHPGSWVAKAPVHQKLIAYSLSVRMPILSAITCRALPRCQISRCMETTGALTLTPQKQFYRRLAWAQIHNGRP